MTCCVIRSGVGMTATGCGRGRLQPNHTDSSRRQVVRATGHPRLGPDRMAPFVTGRERRTWRERRKESLFFSLMLTSDR